MDRPPARPGPRGHDVILLAAAVGSLVAVGVVLVRPGRDDDGELARVGLGVASAVLS